MAYTTLWNTAYFLLLLVANTQLYNIFYTSFIPPLAAELLTCVLYKREKDSFLLDIWVRLRLIVLAMAATHYWYVLPYRYNYENRQLWGTETLVESMMACFQLATVVVVLISMRNLSKLVRKRKSVGSMD